MIGSITTLNLTDDTDTWDVRTIPCTVHGQHYAYTSSSLNLIIVTQSGYQVIEFIAALAQAVTRQTGMDTLSEAARINDVNVEHVSRQDIITGLYDHVRGPQ